jgi:hypothetical protein
VSQSELDDSFSHAAPGFVVCSFSMLHHSVVRTAADRRFWYNFRQAQKTPTRRPPEVAPEWLAGGDMVNSPLSESYVLLVWIYSAQSLPIGPSQELTRPHGLTRRDTQVSEKQRKWVWLENPRGQRKIGQAKRPVGVRFPSRHGPGSREKSSVRSNIRIRHNRI